MGKHTQKQELSQAKEWLKKIKLLDEYVEMEQETRDFKSGGKDRFVLYAVDSDIVLCYSSPWIKGPKTKSSLVPYGVIFPPDENDEEAASALTYTIARYIFFHLDPAWPIFQLPTHSTETSRIFDTVARQGNSSRMQATTLTDQLQAISEKSLENVGSETKKAFRTPSAIDNSAEPGEIIKSILDKLKSFLINRGKSPVAEFEYYLELLIKWAILSTDDADDFFKKTEGLERLGKALIPEDIFDWIEEADDRKRWIVLLKAAHSMKHDHPMKAVNLETDANALTRLNMINRKLEPMGGRMILITGSNTIHKAANEWGKGFSNKYIRHFHSFVPSAFRDVENTEEQAKNEKYNVLRDILGYRALSKNQSPSKKLDVRLRSVLKKNKNAFIDIKQDWISFRKQVTHSSLVLSDDSQTRMVAAFESLRDSLNLNIQTTDFQQELGKFASNIRQEMLNTRLLLVDEFAKTGIEYLQTGKRSDARNPPIIRFDSYKNADHLFSLFRGSSDLKKILIKDELDKLKEDCLSDEVGITDLGYLHFLVFSSIFATLNRWSIAADLAWHAIEIAKQKPATKTNSNVSGREAYYLLAVALRINAGNLDDFELAGKMLDSADEALTQDIASRPALKISPYRFDAERIAIEVGKLHFQSLKNDKYPDIPEEILDRIESGLNNEQQQNKKDDALIVKYAINGLQMISLLLQKENISMTKECVKVDFLQAIKKYQDKIKMFYDIMERAFPDGSNNNLQKTRLMKMYCLFADILLTIINTEQKTGLQEKFNSEFTDMNIEQAKSTVYDIHRYTKLREQCLDIFNCKA